MLSATSFSAVFVLSFFNDPSTTSIYTLSLHDALPIFLTLWVNGAVTCHFDECNVPRGYLGLEGEGYRIEFRDRKSTRLNSSHRCISYAVFCLKKKKKK